MSKGAVEKIHEPHLVTSLLKKTFEQKSDVYVWRMSGRHKLMAVTKLDSMRYEKKELVLVPDEGESDQLKNIIGSSEYIYIYIGAETVLFRSRFKNFSGSEKLTLETPTDLIRINRRKDERLLFDEKLKSNVEFMKTMVCPTIRTTLFRKPLFDLSSQGASIVVTKMEKKYFEVGDLLPSMVVWINEEQYQVDGVVVAVSEVYPNAVNNLFYKGWKISVVFEQMSPKLNKSISAFLEAALAYKRLSS